MKTSQNVKMLVERIRMIGWKEVWIVSGEWCELWVVLLGIEYLLFVNYRLVVLDAGRICEFDSPTTLLNDSNSRFYAMAKDAGIVTWLYVIWLAPWWRHISFCSLNLSLALWIKKPVMLENIAYLYSNVCIAYLPVIFMPSTGYVLQMVFCFLYVLLSWCMSRCSCEHGLVRRVGESITHMQPWRYHMTTVFSSLVYVVMFRSIKWCV